jgi:sugar phosphate isomerase/epimerase
VAYDTLERTPNERIKMIKELGFKKYVYDWRDRHLNDSKDELKIAQENGIEVLGVWLWLNAKRDSLHNLSVANERMFKIIEELELKTTIWVSLSGNFFKELNHKQSLKKAVRYIDFISEKAQKLNCNVALYNHSGWFGNPLNEIEIINALPQHNLSLVYNFHHGHNDVANFSSLSKQITPYLSAVNLNGMHKSKEKIYPLGKGDYEREMITTLRKDGFNGPWGILGHVENTDVKIILERNLQGLNNLFKEKNYGK